MMRRQPKDRPEVHRATAGYHVLLSAWIPGGVPIPVAADLRYDSADPYAVCLSLHSGEPRTVDWVFGRDLLVDGISRRAGIGDVVVEPVPARRVDYVRITLRSETGPFYAQLPVRAVLSFVQQTQAMVRLGAEHRHLDLDGLVRRLTETG
jgi:hypothetical protein